MKPKDTDPAKGGTEGIPGMRQDGFLPLLHVADVPLTLPVWGGKGLEGAKMISTSPGKAQDPFPGRAQELSG